MITGLMAMLACKQEPEPPAEPEPVGPTLTSSGVFRETSNSRGEVEVEIDIAPGVVAVQLTNDIELGYGRVDEWIDPDGVLVASAADWEGRDRSLTTAFAPYNHTTAFNWPVRDVDGELTPGVWTARLVVTDSSGVSTLDDLPVRLWTTWKTDDDLTSSTVAVRLLWAEGVSDDPEVVDAVEVAVERWRTVWANHGVTLAERFEESELDPDLPFAFGGDEAIEDVAKGRDPGELQLVIGDLVFGIGGNYGILGVSGGIPGSVESTPSTFVVLATGMHSGPDGEFDADDRRLMGETMAHEAGHFMGLYHPVELSFDQWDALDDTPRCVSYFECVDELAKNLMFPTPTCTLEGCDPQGQLTEQQVSVVQRYVGAL